MHNRIKIATVISIIRHVRTMFRPNVLTTGAFRLVFIAENVRTFRFSAALLGGIRSSSSNRRERTFIMVKPDGVQRGLTHVVVKRFELRSLKLVAMKLMLAPERILHVHYEALKQNKAFPSIIKYMMSGPVVPMAWEGLEAVRVGRTLIGETNPLDCHGGTLRGDFCLHIGRNLVHGASSLEAAAKEIDLWFRKEELIEWKHAVADWVYELN